ncbi:MULTISPECIES: hypothetical protein [unclassified Nocardia]|uniref:hypothetical protein n=1 Tax=unclassified Nocardia TaxID=2637762 RepID=UPI001CE46011|nr:MULTISPECIES: hypothetical protein [unclassified Nocardia]
MSGGILGSAYLYSGPNLTGTSLLAGLGIGDRYHQIKYADLASNGLLDSISSGTESCSNADFNLIIFDTARYDGGYFQISKDREDGNATFWHTGPAQSALLIASRNRGRNEFRVSFVEQMRDQWNTFLDQRLSGSRASRDGNPLLTWNMFPTDNQWLDKEKTYLRIYQPLLVDLPWPWSTYHASMTYNVQLYVDGANHIRAWVADWECWVDGGQKTGKIHDELDPAVRDGMTALQDQLNAKLASFDALGAVQDVFYLPGKQLSPVGTATPSGNTNDDVTIVIVT